MRDVDERPNRLFYVLIALLFLVYFFTAAAPLRRELALNPVWVSDVSKDTETAAPPPAGRPMAYQLGGRFGAITPDGTIVFSRGAAFDAAVSDSFFIPYTRDSTELSAFGLNGEDLFKIRGEGWPFFRSGRLFLISPEMDAVSEWSLTGDFLWSYDFPFKISDFDASPSLAAAGMLDGNLECVDTQGSQVLSFAPGGSRIEVVLGIAVDPRGEAIAVISGADRQRFVLLVKKGGTYKVQYHTYLDSDYREPVTVKFTQDGRYILYRQPEGIAVFDREKGTETMLPIRAQNFDLVSDSARGLVFLFARTSRARTLVCFKPPAKVIFSYSLPGGAFWSKFMENSLFFGVGDTIGRIDISEE